MRKADRFALGVPIGLVVVVLLLNLVPAWRNSDLRLYDLMLRVRPTIEEDNRFVVLRVDDEAIVQVGAWPWSRDVIGNGLITLKELGADRAVFDIEYMDQSPSGVDRRLLEESIPSAVSVTFSSLLNDSLSLLEAVVDGRLPAEDALEFAGELPQRAEQQQETLMGSIREIERDNDEFMGRAAAAFERAFYTVTLLDFPVQIAPTTQEDLDFAKASLSIGNAPNEHSLERPLRIQPVIRPIGTRAAGAGFTNVVVDPDGVRRRVSILADYEGQLFGQLSFVPLWNMLGRPEIQIDERTIRLTNADHPDYDSPIDIEIPLTTDYRMMINWPQKSFEDSFRQVSYASILAYQELIADLGGFLQQMADAGLFQFIDGPLPTHIFENAENLRRRILIGDIPSDRIHEYLEVRDAFFEETQFVFSGEVEADFLARIDSILERDDLSSEQRARFEEDREEVVTQFANGGGLFEDALELRESLRNTFHDAFIIIGQTGIGTVDIGVNPFEGQYFNVGTHAAVANTILQQNFLVDEPRWVAIVIAGVLGIVVSIGTAKLDTKKSILFGLLSLVLVAGAGAAWFYVTGRYLPLVTPLAAIGIAFVASSAISSVRNSAERAFLRNAFSRYLSADVIGQIIEDPSRLNLGGEKRFMTAMFTDVQGFSTISEQLDPTDLVKLLNAYLSAMSDIVLDVRGTIDKYEGDAIIAFFGAPIDDPEHAIHACESAVKMKRMEAELNERFLADKMSPTPLATRIGINTGDMVVGNMGTERKMDYTIMGHSVNLAARLEGVNKQYGSFILVSETTHDLAGDQFLFRPFDPVRVVGVTEPVQLYELLDERSAASPELIDRVEAFEEAWKLFRGRRFSEAKARFTDLTKEFPGDGPSKTYLKRCITYVETPPPDNWDGVYNLTQK